MVFQVTTDPDDGAGFLRGFSAQKAHQEEQDDNDARDADRNIGSLTPRLQRVQDTGRDLQGSIRYLEARDLHSVAARKKALEGWIPFQGAYSKQTVSKCLIWLRGVRLVGRRDHFLAPEQAQGVGQLEVVILLAGLRLNLWANVRLFPAFLRIKVLRQVGL